MLEENCWQLADLLNCFAFSSILTKSGTITCKAFKSDRPDNHNRNHRTIHEQPLPYIAKMQLKSNLLMAGLAVLGFVIAVTGSPLCTPSGNENTCMYV